jgi:hypothetical protein
MKSLNYEASPAAIWPHEGYIETFISEDLEIAGSAADQPQQSWLSTRVSTLETPLKKHKIRDLEILDARSCPDSQIACLKTRKMTSGSNRYSGALRLASK